MVWRGNCLVIEDDADVGELLKGILAQAGFDVHLETTAAAALVAASEVDFALITLDLGLPDIDGTEVACLLRKHSDAPILIITARTTMNAEAGNTSLAQAYLFKPFLPTNLRDIVDQLLPPGGRPPA